MLSNAINDSGRMAVRVNLGSGVTTLNDEALFLVGGLAVHNRPRGTAAAGPGLGRRRLFRGGKINRFGNLAINNEGARRVPLGGSPTAASRARPTRPSSPDLQACS